MAETEEGELARVQMLWAEMHRGSGHRLQILHGKCVCIYVCTAK